MTPLQIPRFPALALLPAALLAAAGCGPSGEEGQDPQDQACTGPYEPFNADNYANQIVRVGAYEQINEIRRAEDFSAESFDEIEALYLESADLAVKVAGRLDAHSYASVVEIGAVLDQQIRDAIEAGRAGEAIDVQAQVIDKTLQRFFYLSVYHYVSKTQEAGATSADLQKGWDEAFGYFGASNDGTSTTGIATTMGKRDAEFETSLLPTVFNALIEGKCAVAAGDLAAIVPVMERMDRALLEGFALSVVHEMDEYDEDPAVKGTEGLMYWDVVADYARTLDADAHAEVEAEFALGVEAIDPEVVRAAVVRAFGFQV